MRTISIQPAAFTDNVWVNKTGEIVEGKKLPYPFHLDAETGDVEDQDFWRGDPKRVVGFQDDEDVQRVDLWWRDAAGDPQPDPAEMRGFMLLVHNRGKDLEAALRMAATTGLTQRDVADALGLPMNTVGSLNRQWNLGLLR